MIHDELQFDTDCDVALARLFPSADPVDDLDEIPPTTTVHVTFTFDTGDVELARLIVGQFTHGMPKLIRLEMTT